MYSSKQVLSFAVISAQFIALVLGQIESNHCLDSQFPDLSQFVDYEEKYQQKV